ncbi:3-deoxy-manno-octulosonate cytidylyltransferase (CMP-KDO synthetase) [Sphingobacterium nematocida]|uniref:3-deoxy-manno-octulosonate cytidylyltransferase n=1 Tax=Sphingobacterium nematocida TaxID=1513896 RepID=A0A1T5CNP8_9SPHI|nr:3-deoxy-manno-octulosonate cytidylyltransferase [Sphingobacterium nematocida]SKB61057.1 3-deoxy-manno-octulosonate cytidylyltransferase (CMP-KDO synthetase) [Sphingobacterium nematocida]
MKTIGIIPARYDSSRFPGKPLIDIGGISMIQRVYNQAKHASSLDEVIVATDDQRIFDHVKNFAGNVIMTKKDHQSGTDRCAEVIENIQGFDVAINIQGDEPFIDPLQINLLRSCFDNQNTQIATLIRKVETFEELFNENKPKVVVSKNGEAIYFSRQAVPFLRGTKKEDWLKQRPYYNHIGIYGYSVPILKELAALPYSDLEAMEALEQLRWLDNGYKIHTAISSHSNEAIDTPEDLKLLVAKYFNT